MDSIAIEEKLNVSSTGTTKLLSFNEKFRLMRDFLDFRANPHKNRVFQQLKTTIEENRDKKERERLAEERKRKQK